ncbi:sigma-70 family RNA polymerase sigma factor [Candidatus Sumerlaeota bacterium]|nr:sigma-70 family RNA polymerase sigma factor [Candidatus Sumerlaeota bacterium]
MIDLERVAQFQLGELDAFEALMRGESARMLGFIRRYVRSAELADDIFQEVCIRVWKNRAQLKNRSRFRSWMYQIARNAIFDQLKSEDWRLEIEFYGDEVTALTSVRDSIKEPRQQAALREWNRIVSAEIRKLDPKSQEIVALHFAAGLNLREAADALNMKHSTLRSRLCRILRQLRRSLEQKGIQSGILKP